MIEQAKIDPFWDRVKFVYHMRRGDRANAVRLYAYMLRRDAWVNSRKEVRNAA